MNLYAYAGNNPLSFSDPFGLRADDCCIETGNPKTDDALHPAVYGGPRDNPLLAVAVGLLAVVGGAELLAPRLITAGALAGPSVPKLSQDLANTFEEGRYAAERLTTDMRVFRVFDGQNAAKVGRFFSTAPQTSSNGARAALNLYANNATRMVEAVIPKGTVVYSGQVAGGTAGSTQVLVPNSSQVVRFGIETVLK